MPPTSCGITQIPNRAQGRLPLRRGQRPASLAHAAGSETALLRGSEMHPTCFVNRQNRPNNGIVRHILSNAIDDKDLQVITLVGHYHL